MLKLHWSSKIVKSYWKFSNNFWRFKILNIFYSGKIFKKLSLILKSFEFLNKFVTVLLNKIILKFCQR